MTIVATVNVSPQYLSVPNYASIQAAIDQIIIDYSGDITGQGNLEIWVNGAQSTGNIDTTGLTSDATGYLEIIGINLPVWTLSETLQLSGNVSTRGYHVLRGFHFQPGAGFSGIATVDPRWGCKVYDFVASNPNNISSSGVYAASAAAGCDVSNGLVYGFDNANAYTGVWLAVGTASNVTAYQNGRGFGGNAGFTTIDCVGINSNDTDFEADIGQSYNGSSDLTATGTGSLTSLVATDQYVDPVNGDFTLKSGNSISTASSTGGPMGYVEVLHTLPSTFSADSFTGGALVEGTTRRINLSNAPSTSGRAVSIGAGALTVVGEGAGYVDVLIPNLRTFGDLTGQYNVNTTFTVVDGAESDTIDAPILPLSGYEVGTITALEGVWGAPEVTGVAVSDRYYGPIISGADLSVGAVPVLPTEQVIPIQFQDLTDGQWKEGFIFTIAAGAADETKPVITLLGGTVVAHTINTTYTDAGATASDNIDGDITGNIVVTGTVNENAVGIYVLYYNVSDAAGNPADQVSRIVAVTDPSAGTSRNSIIKPIIKPTVQPIIQPIIE